MTTPSIATALRHRIAAAFGSKDARRLLDQQKRDRLFLKDLKNTSNTKSAASADSPDTKAPSAGRTRLPVPTIMAVPKTVSGQQGGWLHTHWLPSALKSGTAGIAVVSAPADTTDAPKVGATAALGAGKCKVAPDAPRLPVPANGKELHPNALIRQTVINGPFDRMSHLNHQATALINAEDDIASMFGELDPADMQPAPSLLLQQGVFTLPRAHLGPNTRVVDHESDGGSVPADYDSDSGSDIVSCASLSDSEWGEEWDDLTPEALADVEERFRQQDDEIAQSNARTPRPALPVKTAKVLAHAEDLRAFRAAQQAETPVTAQPRPIPVKGDASTIVGAQTLNAPPPPPPEPTRPAAQAHASAGGLFAEMLKNPLVKSRSLEEQGTVSFGTASKSPVSSAQSISRKKEDPLLAELRKAMDARRAIIEPNEDRADASRAAATHVRAEPRPEEIVATRAKEMVPAIRVPQISKELKNSMFQELQEKLAARPQGRAM